MTTFYVFANDNYYPEGGAWDFRGFASTMDEARDIIKKIPGYDMWAHIAAPTMEIVERWECGYTEFTWEKMA